MSTQNGSGPVRTAVIGLGRAGWSIHVAGIKDRSDYKIVACVDPDAERRKEAEQTLGCRTFATLKEFLKDPGDTELVIVATASHQHTPMSIEALQAGFHVMTEKPMAINLKEAEKMMKAAKKSKKLFTIHQNYRCQPELHQAMALIHSGILGKVFYIKMNWTNFARRNDWQTLRKYGGGQLNNNGVHLIDQVVQLLDSRVTAVFGDLQQILNPGDGEDHVKVVFRAESGMLAEVEITQSALPQPAWVVLGTRGTLISDGETFRLRYVVGRLKPLKPIDAKAVAGRKYGFGEKIEFKEETLPAAITPKRNFYDYLYDSIRKGKPPYVTPESVRNTMEVMRLARKGTQFS